MSDAGSATMTCAPRSLMERLLAHGWTFDFFQAVWMLERYCGDGTPVGGRGPVASEGLRFRPDVSLGFPPSDVRKITRRVEPTTDRETFYLEVSFLGLYGVSTPLPIHYAIDVLRSVEHFVAATATLPDSSEERTSHTEQEETGSAPVRDFLDIFHHRLISLFYRSWLKYRYEVSFGLPERGAITDYLLWFIGCAPTQDAETLGVSPVQMIRYAGLMTQRPRSAAALEGLLRDYWDEVGVEVEQCVGRWVPLSPADLNSVGSRNSTFGLDLTLGAQVYDLSGAFNVSVGPMDWATYQSFLPDGSSFAETRSLVQLYATDPLSFTIELKLKPAEVPEMRLTSAADAGRLGFTSWVRTDDLPATSVRFSSAPVRPLGNEPADEMPLETAVAGDEWM